MPHRLLRRSSAPMFARTACALALLALIMEPAAADEPKAFVCRFTVGVAHVYEKGSFVAEQAAPVSFGIEAINTTGQTADLRTAQGRGPLRVVQAVNALHFLEVVTEGFLNITTIYDKDETTGSYPAVHS